MTQDAPDAAIGAVLALLADGLPAGGVALLAMPVDAGRMIVADSDGKGDLVGRDMPVPPDLLGDAPILLYTQGLRLPLAWTLACGDRPAHFAAAPVPGHRLSVIAAWCGPPANPLAGVTMAAQVIARLLSVGQMTGAQANASDRIAALVRHLPVPLVFVDSLGLQVLINDEARRLLQLGTGEARHTEIAAALARLINLEGTRAQQHQMTADPKATLAFDIRRGEQTFKVDSRWIDDGALSGRIWIFADVTEAQNLQASLSRLAGEDSLTGVLNRRSFEERLQAAADRADRAGPGLALLTLDLDHFKRINDTFGHQAGDQVLRHVCHVVTGALRPDAVLARIGGEEFAILITHLRPEDSARVAQRICGAVRNATLALPEGPLQVTCSIGVAAYVPGLDTPATLLARSDAALYTAKHEGRDRIAVAPHHIAPYHIGPHRHGTESR